MFKQFGLFIVIMTLGIMALVSPAQEPKKNVAKYLQDISVTVKADNVSGSGVMFQTKDKQIWIWTCGHVVAHLRHTHEVLEESGKRQKIEFDDAKILRFHIDKNEGRTVSSYTADAEVIRYSDAEYGNDLALLRLRDKDFVPAASAKFYLDNNIPEVGEEVLHCGSLLGTLGSNSVTSGIISQHGRVFNKRIFDQTTATSFPGSSGGVVALKSDGRYVGMLVMGAGEGFGIIVPVRRMQSWAKKVGIEFAIDDTLPVPTDEVLKKNGIEDAAHIPSTNKDDKKNKELMEAAGLQYKIY